MQEKNSTPRNSPLRYPYFLEYLFKTSIFFLHSTFFVGAALIGIARYAFTAPAALTLFMTIWGIVLLLHGVMTWQKERSIVSGDIKPKDGIFKTVFFASILNAVTWSMWTLATDAGSAAPFHLTVMIALIATAVSSLIMGKRLLYAHWLREFHREHSTYFDETKVKHRGYSEEALQLEDDGELSPLFEDTNDRRLQSR